MKETLIEVKQWLTALTGNMWKSVFLILALGLGLLLPILSQDAGMTDDERIHNEHGQRILHYYTQGDPSAALSPIDSDGLWHYQRDPSNYALNINIYGGFFDFVAAALYSGLTHHIMGEYESRHLLSAICGVLMMVLTGLIALTLTGDWAVAVIALLLMICSPRLIGHSMNNPKDIPFAAACAFSMYQILLALRERLQWRWTRLLWLVLSFAIAIDCRVGGVLMIVFFGFGVAAMIAYEIYYEQKKPQTYIRPLIYAFGIAIVGYITSSLCWPFALQNPLLNPLHSLSILSNFNQFNSYELFEGRWITNKEIPWYFIEKWFYLTMPVCFLMGMAIFLILGYGYFNTRRDQWIPYGLVLLSGVLPLLVIIVKKSNVYDDGRHLYFVLPSLYALAAVGWYWLFQKINSRDTLYAVLVTLGLMAIEPIGFMIVAHPHEAMYFTPLIGGVKGAFKQYEMDYWGFSLRAAADWIEHTDTALAKDRKTRVRMWYGEQLKLKYYADKSKHLEYVLTNMESPDWDYTLMLPVESKYNADLLYHWPPAHTVHEITIGSTPLCAIVRNPRAGEATTPVNINSGANDFLNLGLSKYKAGDYNGAIVAFRQMLQADSTSVLAINNLVSTYNMLKMYDDAIRIGKRGLSLQPDYTLLKNNLKVSTDGRKAQKLDESYYLGLSYNYYMQQEYGACIKASELLLQINPNSAKAYNNICSGYNVLGEYAKAKAACEKALAIDPNSELTKNNMATAVAGLKK